MMFKVREALINALESLREVAEEAAIFTYGTVADYTIQDFSLPTEMNHPDVERI